LPSSSSPSTRATGATGRSIRSPTRWSTCAPSSSRSVESPTSLHGNVPSRGTPSFRPLSPRGQPRRSRPPPSGPPLRAHDRADNQPTDDTTRYDQPRFDCRRGTRCGRGGWRCQQ
jgi:hypothetical protein